MTGSASSSSVFASPYELHCAVRTHRREIVEAAARHHIDVADTDVLAVANAAVAAHAVVTATHEITGRKHPLQVVDGSTLVHDIETFLAGGGTFVVPGPPRVSWRTKISEAWTRFAWSPIGRSIVENVWRTPAGVWNQAFSGPMRPIQHRGEIIQLLEIMRTRNPTDVLEIGTLNGGTTYLLSRFTAPNGSVVTCDLAPRLTPEQLRKGSRRHQQIDVLTLDSHDPASRSLLHDRFPSGVDVLFIDGDHHYAGVRQDLLDYGDLLRPGALVVFHDIVEDYRTRYGIKTMSWVGGVPRLWRELRAVLPEGFVAIEFVSDPYQDGLGIGIVQCPQQAAPGATLVEAYAAAY